MLDSTGGLKTNKLSESAPTLIAQRSEPQAKLALVKVNNATTTSTATDQALVTARFFKVLICRLGIVQRRYRNGPLDRRSCRVQPYGNLRLGIGSIRCVPILKASLPVTAAASLQ